MPASWLKTQNIRPRQILAAGLGLLLLAGWYFGWGTGAPADRDKQKFIDWGFVSNSDGVGGLLEDGRETLIKKAMFKAIDSVECHRNTEGRRLFQKWQRGFPRYDCLYDLLGQAGEKYLTALSAFYMPKSELAQVGSYRVMYWAVDPDQRRLFALYGRELPKPAN